MRVGLVRARGRGVRGGAPQRSRPTENALAAAAARAVARRQVFLYNDDVFAGRPVLVEPEGSAGGVAGEEEEVALVNLQRDESVEAGGNESAADAVFALGSLDGEVVQVAAASVVAAEDGADDPASRITGDGAQAGVAFEKRSDGFAGVGVTQAHALRLLPQRVHGVVVGDEKGAQGETFQRGAWRNGG